MRRARLFGEPRQGIKNTIRQPEMSERRCPPARALAAGADVQRPGSCEQLDRPSSIDRPAAEFAK